MDQETIIEKIATLQNKIHELRHALIEREKEEYNVHVINQQIEDNWSLYHGDCVEVVKGIPTNSVHYSIFSPPFLSLYVYSDDFRDLGNSKNEDEFYTHFAYLIPELLRILMPGRLVSVHCSVINSSITHDGVMGLKDFPGELVRQFTSKGFIYHSKVMIWKDPLIQAVRTKMLTLAHKQISKDSSRCGMGFADEILTFRKPGDNPEPVAHGRGFERYIGTQANPKETKVDDPRINKYSHKVWQRYASPVWFDIDQTDTLNFKVAKDNRDEKHICPLQIQTIERCLELWTNENDIVFSPFAGIGSEGYAALTMGRRFVGAELKASYYKTAVRNLRSVVRGKGFSL